GTLAGTLTNSGTIAASGGTLLVQGKLSGTGPLVAGNNAVLDLAGGGALAKSISGAGTLQLDGSTAFTLAAVDRLTVSTVSVDAGAKLSGAGTIAGAL